MPEGGAKGANACDQLSQHAGRHTGASVRQNTNLRKRPDLKLGSSQTHSNKGSGTGKWQCHDVVSPPPRRSISSTNRLLMRVCGGQKAVRGTGLKEKPAPGLGLARRSPCPQPISMSGRHTRFNAAPEANNTCNYRRPRSLAQAAALYSAALLRQPRALVRAWL